jgi:hypothetical protein
MRWRRVARKHPRDILIELAHTRELLGVRSEDGLFKLIA